MSICDILRAIRAGEVVLPSIQRDFVWDEARIFMLLDSILRGYPIGGVLLWETYLPLQFRVFEQNYRPGTTQHAFRQNGGHRRVRVVLDGQQRLQSLFVAVHGTYDGRQLFFDVFSGSDEDDVRAIRYRFRFLSPADAEAQRGRALHQVEKGNGAHEWFVNVSDLLAMQRRRRQQLLSRLRRQLRLDRADASLVEANVERLIRTFTRDENVLKASVIDENLPRRSTARQSESDVLEVFVRINQQGQPLSRPDLIFSILKLNWKQSAEDLPQFVQAINRGNSFHIDNDFVIRSLLAVCGLGTKFDVELLRRKSNVERLRAAFPQCRGAIESMLDFVSRECWCQSSALLGGTNTLVPFTYLFYHLPKHEIGDADLVETRKVLYLFGFCRPFSRYADTRLTPFLRDQLSPHLAMGNRCIPFAESLVACLRWKSLVEWNDGILQQNPSLALHLVQQHTGAKVLYANNAPEIDHIFPQSVLRARGIPEEKIDHLGNKWILAKGKNRNKSNSDPAVYFADVPTSELRRARINRALLRYDLYEEFLETRMNELRKVVNAKLGFVLPKPRAADAAAPGQVRSA